MKAMRGVWIAAMTAAITVMVAACATLDEYASAETYRLDRAPYVVDVAKPRPAPGSCAIVLPATIDPELEGSFTYGDRTAELAPLIVAVNARIATRGGCIRAITPGPSATGAPRVFVGGAESDYVPPEASSMRNPTDRFPPMVLHLVRPDAAWRHETGALIAKAGTPYAISVQVGISQYMKGYPGVFSKEVVLGTGNHEPIRFLTAEDKLVEVLHLTGVLVDASGKPVRAGAEGVVLRDTPFLAQAVGASRSLDDSELQRVLKDERRRDLPGAPLKLDVALDNLLAQLTRAEVRVPAR
jgi:hypothetical protein